MIRMRGVLPPLGLLTVMAIGCVSPRECGMSPAEAASYPRVGLYESTSVQKLFRAVGFLEDGWEERVFHLEPEKGFDRATPHREFRYCVVLDDCALRRFSSATVPAFRGVDGPKRALVDAIVSFRGQSLHCPLGELVIHKIVAIRPVLPSEWESLTGR